MKKIFIYLLLILLVNISFLFSGPQEIKGPDSYCPHHYIRLNRYMGVPVNCDEFLFIGAAVQPQLLFQQNFQRQSRPLYILSGAAIGYSIYYVLSPFHQQIKSFTSDKLSTAFSDIQVDKSVLYVCVYAGFIIINMLILLASMLLFEKCVTMISGEWKNKPVVFLACLVLLITNQVTKTFFWTAHLQMFTILTPIAYVYCFIIIAQKKSSTKKTFLINIAGGFLFLMYGNFLLLLLSIIAGCLYHLKSANLVYRFKTVITVLLLVVTFFMPFVLWIVILKSMGIRFYSYEISEFHQFQWIIDTSITRFPRVLFYNTLDFLKTSGCLVFSVFFLCLAFAIQNYSKKNVPVTVRKPLNSPSRIQLFLPFLIVFIFLWLMGYYADRLTLTLAPLLLIFTAIKLNERPLNLNTQRMVAALVLISLLYTIFYDSPHFSEELFFL